MRWPGHGFVLAAAAALLLAWGGAMWMTIRAAALPGDASGLMLAMFRPGMSGDDILARVIAAEGTPVRPTWLPFVWTVASDTPGLPARLKAAGAIGAYASLPFAPAPAGCVGYAEEELFTLRP